MLRRQHKLNKDNPPLFAIARKCDQERTGFLQRVPSIERKSATSTVWLMSYGSSADEVRRGEGEGE